MKNSFLAIKDKIVTKYLLIDHSLSETKSTNINVLLNRVRLDQKKKVEKNYYLQPSHHLVLFYLVY